MNLTEIVQSKVYKGFMAKLYGWGAAVVLLGAMFKINHYPGAGIMLLIGLSVEAAIFFFSAFEPLHEQYDWSLVYPELAGIEEVDAASSRPATAESLADLILEKAEVSNETLEKLGTGIHKLSETTSALSEVSEASVATKDYVASVQKASATMDGISASSGAYQELSETLSKNLQTVATGSTSYSSQLESLNKNLVALNSVYEMQLQGTESHMKNSQVATEGLTKMLDNLNASVSSTEKYRDEVTKLGDKLEALNTIYGNMLSAMNVNK